MKKNDKLVWIDLEMTGLNPAVDSIIEIATIITNDNLDIVSVGPSVVIHQPEEKLALMDGWNIKQHTSSGLLRSVKNSNVNILQAQEIILSFLKNYCDAFVSPLCGNSVWLDRLFLKNHMPELEAFMHYRTIDVSSVKELVKRWYVNNDKKDFIKKDTHRALEDIQESISELLYYKKYFFTNY